MKTGNTSRFRSFVRVVIWMAVLLLPFCVMAKDAELCVNPDAPLPEIFKAAEVAVSRLEKLPPKTFIKANFSRAMRASADLDIVYLDEQLMRYIVLQKIDGPKALELKWRQYPAGCREKRILILLLHWNYLPENLDAPQPEGGMGYKDLSAWNPMSQEYKERREEIEYIRKNGRAVYDRIQTMIHRGYKQNRLFLGWILGGCVVWVIACAVIHPFLRRTENGHNIPTTASVTVRWLGILGPIAAMAVYIIYNLFF